MELNNYKVKTSINGKAYLNQNERERKLLQNLEDLTLREAFEDYASSRSEELSASTLNGYKNLCAAHFEYIMDMRLRVLSEAMLQKAFDREIEKGYKKSTLLRYKRIIVKVINNYRSDFNPYIDLDAAAK